MNLDELNISSERLILRDIKLTDAKDMHGYRSDPNICDFQNWKPQTLGEVEDFILNKIAKEFNTPNTWYQIGIFIKGCGEIIGDIGVHFLEEDNLQVEIGYTLSTGYQGKGYASEAVTALINFLFKNLNKHRITASVDPRNMKSIALLERIGMRKEAHFKKSIWFNDEWTDDIIYAILREEWVGQSKKEL
jgi:RimJ/RimL family protein N-acetyltransferase